MKEGDVVLTPILQADGRTKNRPAVVLREMPPYSDLLVCGVSAQLHQQVRGFDALIVPQDDDFAASGLLAASVIRLGYLAVLPRRRILGSIGSISPQRHKQLLKNLSNHLLQSLQAE